LILSFRIKTLTELNVSHNKLNGQRAQYLFDSLRVNKVKKLRIISFSHVHSKLNGQRAQYLFDSLRVNKVKKLRIISFSHVHSSYIDIENIEFNVHLYSSTIGSVFIFCITDKYSK